MYKYLLFVTPNVSENARTYHQGALVFCAVASVCLSASRLNSCILQGDKAIILPEKRGLTRKVYTHTHTHTSFRTQPTPGTPQILLFSLGHLPLIMESSCSRALSVLSGPQSSVQTYSVSQKVSYNIELQKRRNCILDSFFPKVLLEPHAKFPNSSPVTAKYAKTRNIGRGNLKPPIILFMQGNGCLLNLHH